MSGAVRRIVLAAVLLACGRLPAGAAITLDVTLSPEVRGDGVHVVVRVRNRGGDPANDVIPRLRFENAARNGLPQHLNAGDTHEWPVDFARPEHDGRYPLTATVSYADNGYRGYSAVSAALVDVGSVPPSGIHGAVAPLAVDVEAPLVITVQNDDPTPRKLTAGALLPDELGGWRDLGRLAATPGRPATLQTPVQVRGAVAGSAYGVQVVVRAVSGDVQTAALLPGTIRVVGATPLDWKQVVRRIAIGLGGLFVVTELVLGVRALRRRRA